MQSESCAEKKREKMGDSHSHKGLIIALVVAGSSFASALFLSACFWICRRNRQERAQRNSSPTSDSEDAELGLSMTSFLGKFSSLRMVNKKVPILVMDYQLLEKSTGNFHEGNVLGKGAFGCVYKGKLEDDIHIAVKKLDSSTNDASKVFESEVGLLSRMHHPNVISLLGYCVDGQSKFIVYELMQNGSLETHLYGPSQGSALTWYTRMKIALDIARGLEYLHERCNPPVIHRDLKSANILLDANYNAKLSDFGLAITEVTRKKNKVKLSGTLGYVAPEYVLDGLLTDKSDVYAFGVVLLELLLGRRPLEKLGQDECQSVVNWAMPQLTDRAKLPDIVHPAIKDTVDTKQLYQAAAVAVLCLQPQPSYRPLIRDVLYSLVPLVPIELGGTLMVR
ncbi:hypothetical protein MLD38_014580 [Melastoma candidum]|uniref:Uncharacterized protein n=1 Tax=Melastoma candidum TaxID=119954 RepID=A0ACB9RF46_9MYRT|nr:hypothetical protein MLD38_014580 [Melastoma candidum]